MCIRDRYWLSNNNEPLRQTTFQEAFNYWSELATLKTEDSAAQVNKTLLLDECDSYACQLVFYEGLPDGAFLFTIKTKRHDNITFIEDGSSYKIEAFSQISVFNLIHIPRKIITGFYELILNIFNGEWAWSGFEVDYILSDPQLRWYAFASCNHLGTCDGNISAKQIRCALKAVLEGENPSLTRGGLGLAIGNRADFSLDLRIYSDYESFQFNYPWSIPVNSREGDKGWSLTSHCW